MRSLKKRDSGKLTLQRLRLEELRDSAKKRLRKPWRREINLLRKSTRFIKEVSNMRSPWENLDSQETTTEIVTISVRKLALWQIRSPILWMSTLVASFRSARTVSPNLTSSFLKREFCPCNSRSRLLWSKQRHRHTWISRIRTIAFCSVTSIAPRIHALSTRKICPSRLSWRAPGIDVTADSTSVSPFKINTINSSKKRNQSSSPPKKKNCH